MQRQYIFSASRPCIVVALLCVSPSVVIVFRAEMDRRPSALLARHAPWNSTAHSTVPSSLAGFDPSAQEQLRVRSAAS